MARKPTVGIHIASSVAYVGIVDPSKGPRPDDPLERFTLASSLQGSEQLADFSSQVEQELRRIDPKCLGILQPNKHRNWVYAHAFSRVTLEAAIMIAASRVGVTVHAITPSDAAKVMGSGSELPKLTAAAEGELRMAQTRYWNQGRALAFVTAHVLQEGVPS